MNRVAAFVRRHPVGSGVGVVLLATVGVSVWALVAMLRVPSVEVGRDAPDAPRLSATAPGQSLFRIDATRSSVSYEVTESLAGTEHTATGITRGVAGDVVLDTDHPDASRVGEIVVNLEQLTSDQDLRDQRLRHDYLESSRHPLSRFRTTAVEGWPASIADGVGYDLVLRGDLTVKEITASAELRIAATRTGGELHLTGTTTVKLSTFGIGPINLAGFVTTGDDAILKFDVVLVDASRGVSGDVAAPGTTTGTEIVPPVPGPSFSAAIQPILERSCASCHNPGGAGTQVWRLETASDAAAVASGLGLVTKAGYMPPWPASPAGVPLKHDRTMSAADVDAVTAWAAAGGLLDVDPSTPVKATPDTNGGPGVRADLDLASEEPYQGSTEKRNDYRCFLLDPGLDQESFLTGLEFVPDQPEIVHHALAFRTDGSQVGMLQELDGKDPGAGWGCYAGSAGPGGDVSPTGGTKKSTQLMAWAPGQAPTRYPDGSGIKMAVDDVLVMQVHYHYGHDTPADQSRLHVEVSDRRDLDEIHVRTYLGPAEIPCGPEESGEWCDRDKVIERLEKEFGPAARVIADGLHLVCDTELDEVAKLVDGIASSRCDHEVLEDGELIGVMGHEHEIGRSFRMTLNPGSPQEQILLDIPAWDFNWQMVYEPRDPIMLRAGDTIRVDCSWDRSLFKGAEPAYVTWAEGTEDEMCYSLVNTRVR